MEDHSLQLAHTIIAVLDEKKGEDILLLDLSELNTFTDGFVICTALSERTLKALSGEVREKVKEQLSKAPYNSEGDAESGWVLLDYGDIVVHLFTATIRDYYRLEEFWSEGQILLRMS